MEEKTKTITLRVPIQLKKDGPVYKVLLLRKPTNAEILRMAGKKDGPIYKTLKLHKPTDEQIMRMAGKDAFRAISQLISDVSGVPLPVIDKLGISQWNEARDFLLSIRKKGE
jgi:hypothetical protein